MAIQCQIENGWGLPGNTVSQGRKNGLIVAYTQLGVSPNNIEEQAIGNFLESLEQFTGHSDIVMDYRVYNPVYYLNGQAVGSGQWITDQQFDDYYISLNSLNIDYRHVSNGFTLNATLVINFEETIKIRTVVDFYNIFVAAGFEGLELIDVDFVQPSIKCIDTETNETTVNIIGNPITDMAVTTTIIDGDSPLTSLENGGAKIEILNNGFISMYGPGGTFFLNEHGAAGFYAFNEASLSGNNKSFISAGNLTMGIDRGNYYFQQGPERINVSFEKIKEVFGD